MWLPRIGGKSMRQEEVEEVYAIARQVFREEIKLVIESLKVESKPEVEEIVILKEEVEENAK
jgi:hydroxypyruvate isomerase